MPLEEKRANQHNLMLENREKISMSGVEDVESFDEENMVIATCMGTVLVHGAGLHINKFNVDSGELVIEGEIDEVLYSDGAAGKKGVFSRLFG